ncbi:type II toxin-antitoxin system RelE/ParE family toxin [soil metagenome]
MIREIYWTEPARLDLAQLRIWVKSYAPNREKIEGLRIKEAIDKLVEFPRIGKRVQIPDEGTEELRELFIAPYVIQYSVEVKAICIIRLWHYRQERINVYR